MEGNDVFGGIDNLVWFIVAGVLLNLTPGPDVLYIVTQALKSGWRTGAVAALGITAGCFVHVAAAALGLSALMAASSTAFSILKWLGAAYLVYVGWRLLDLGVPGRARTGRRARPARLAKLAPSPEITVYLIANKSMNTGTGSQNHLKMVFIKGFWINVLNPKVALFFLAFLPQFITPGGPHPTVSFLVLGLVFNANSLWVNLGYAGVGAAASRRFATLQRGLRGLERAAGALFIGFGLKLALTDNPVTP